MVYRVGAAIKKLQLAVRVAADAALAKQGLSVAQYAALEVLLEHERLPCAELARRCSIKRQSMQDLVRALEASGIIEKSQDPEDTRHVVVALTRTGRAAAHTARATMSRLEERMTRGLTRAERSQLLAWLDVCVDNLEEGDPPLRPSLSGRKR